MSSFSTVLFASCGFRTGMARVLDIGAQFTGYNYYSMSPYAADALAMHADWRTVGNDLRAGIRTAASWEDPQQPWLFSPEEVKR